MNNREFVALVKRETVDWAVPSLMRELQVPPELLVRNESDTLISQRITDLINLYRGRKRRQSEWFRLLCHEDQLMVRELLEESSMNTAKSFFSLIDGVSGEYEGVFEIVAVSQNERTVINPQNTEMLHDLFSEACAK